MLVYLLVVFFALNFTGNNTISVIGTAQPNMTPTFPSRSFVDHDNEEAILEQKATNPHPVFIETEHEPLERPTSNPFSGEKLSDNENEAQSLFQGKCQ